MAVRSEDGGPRSYRLDRILGARATDRVFAARFPVELTPAGPLSIPDRETRSSETGSGWGGLEHSGPTYVYRCSVCGREFERRTMDGTLRAHKNRSGRDCYGRTGIYVRTKY
jgi:hypothetical protein